MLYLLSQAPFSDSSRPQLVHPSIRDPNGLAEAFTTRHDTSHVLSGYTTSAPGELLVSTFIAGMHPDQPMAAEVLPALFSYHLGTAMNEIASVRQAAFEPKAFWTAWDRRGGHHR